MVQSNFKRSLMRVASVVCMIGAVPVATEAANAQTTQETEDAASTLETVIVTARRREENLQDTPVSITALTAEGLERQQINSTEDLDLVTPGLQFANYGPLSGNNSAAQVFIRGIGQTDPTPAVDPGVGLYVDEVYMGRAVGGVMEFRDIAGVQVLRGPQGTLFGRNTIGGAVLITSADPDDELGGDLRVKVGSDNLIEAFGAVDLPLGEGLLSRFSGGIRKRDGYVRRIVDGLDLGDDNTFSLTGKVLWEPSDTVRLMFKADYTEEDENGSPYVFKDIDETAVFPIAVSVGAGCPGAAFPPPTPVPMIDDPRCANSFYDMGPFRNGGDAETFSTLENWGVATIAAWDALPWLTLKSITSYRELDWSGARDGDNTPFVIIDTSIRSSTEQFSQEFQAAADLEKLTGVVGVYYFDETSDDELRVRFGAPTPFVLAGGAPSRDLALVDLTTESVALFSQWTLEVTDALSVSAGIRYTDEEKSIQGFWQSFTPGDVPDSDPIPTTVPPLYLYPDVFSTDFSSVIGSASIQYRWNDSLSTYASWSQGFKGGGFNQRYNLPPAGNVPLPFDEEKANTFEIGFKSDIAGVLRLNGSGYQTDYDDMQLVYRFGAVPLLFNAGKSKISGFELEATYAPSSNLTVDASLGYLKDEIKEIAVVPGADATVGPNNSLPFTPEWTGHVGVSYSFHPFGPSFRLTPRINYAYTDSQYFDAVNSISIAQNDAVNLLNLSVKLDDEVGNWSVTAGLENATDELYPVAGTSTLGTASGYAEIIYARPRQWYVELSRSF